jgi:hypothetical protein
MNMSVDQALNLLRQLAEAARPQADLISDAVAAGLGAESLGTGVILLNHGHLERAHELSQMDKGTLGCWLHGLMHRLEPDLPNACYWFRRAGAHPLQAVIADQLAGQVPAGLEAVISTAGFSPLALTEALMADAKLAPAVARVQAVEERELLRAVC